MGGMPDIPFVIVKPWIALERGLTFLPAGSYSFTVKPPKPTPSMKVCTSPKSSPLAENIAELAGP